MSECSMVLKEFENLKRNALKLLKDAKVLISDSYQMRKGYLYINTPRSVHNVLDIRDMIDDLKDLANGVFKNVAKMKDSCNAYDARKALKTAVEALESAVNGLHANQSPKAKLKRFVMHTLKSFQMMNLVLKSIQG